MKRLLVFVAALALPLLLSDVAMNQPVKIIENLRHEEVLLPVSVPDKAQMAQVDSRLFVEPGGAAGVLFFYDDPGTKTPVDYIEFYDPEGHLLLVSWIDRFGICQAAMDRGLLDAKYPKAEKVLVIISMGTAL
jgi:hypothetical protein